MAISFDSAFGIHDQALILRAHRSRLLAENIANADTPGYRARDLDFRRVLSAAGGATEMAGTDPAHMRASAASGLGAKPGYRVALQPSLDGNTVDVHVEKASFLENAVRYQASLSFLSARIQALRTAIGAR